MQTKKGSQSAHRSRVLQTWPGEHTSTAGISWWAASPFTDMTSYACESLWYCVTLQPACIFTVVGKQASARHQCFLFVSFVLLVFLLRSAMTLDHQPFSERLGALLWILCAVRRRVCAIARVIVRSSRTQTHLKTKGHKIWCLSLAVSAVVP